MVPFRTEARVNQRCDIARHPGVRGTAPPGRRQSEREFGPTMAREGGRYRTETLRSRIPSTRARGNQKSGRATAGARRLGIGTG